MAGRTTTDPKETTLKLRLNDEMRTHIEKSAKRKGTSMSEYLRQLIYTDMKNNSLIPTGKPVGLRNNPK